MRTLLTLIVASTVITNGAAQELLRDLNTQLSLDKPVPEPREMSTVDGITYFSAEPPTLPHGRELWRTDGTLSGTSLAVDIAPSTGDSNPAEIVDLGDGTFIFRAKTDVGRELWRSDGTKAGTTLIKDIAPGTDSSSPSRLALYDGRVYFFADDGVVGDELWSTDGTSAGTVLEADLIAGSDGSVGRIIATPSRLFVVSPVSTTSLAFTLYAKTKTEPLAPIYTGQLRTKLEDLDVVTFGADLLYLPTSETPLISDGTVKGTYSVCDCDVAASAVAAGNSVFFVARTPATGYELWTTDGTEVGTFLVEDIYPGPENGAVVSRLLSLGDGVIALTAFRPDVSRAIFIAHKTSVRLFYDLPSPAVNPQLVSALGGGFVFATSGSPGTLFFGDTAHNTVTPLADNFGKVTTSAVNADTLVLSLDVSDSGNSLVATDGTIANTELIDIAPHDTLSSSPSAPIPAGDLSFFFASTEDEGRELWKSDGTSGGTRLVADITPGPASSVVGDATLIPLGNRVVFMVDAPLDAAPYVSDGTVEGTFPLAPSSTATLQSDIVAFNGEVFFFHADDTSGRQIWKTDGTVAGTQLAVKVNAAGISQGAFSPVDDQLYFTVLSGSGLEPWVTDGTQAGTTLLADIVPGFGSSKPDGFTAFGDMVIFAAETPELGRELWKTNGTAAGTSLALDVFPGGSAIPRDLITIGDRLVFTAFTTPTHAKVISTDKTFESIDVLYDWQSTPDGLMVRVDDRILVFELMGPTRGIHATDGTIAGTTQIIGLETAVPHQLLGKPGSDERVVFTGFSPPYAGPLHPKGLWVTDGTTVGTRLVTSQTTAPLNIGRIGNRAVFSDFSKLYGLELFTIPLSDTGASVAQVMGAGCAGTFGVPEISTTGTASTGEAFSIDLSGALPNALSYLVISTSVGSFGPDGCTLIPDPLLRLPFATDGTGNLSLPIVPDTSFVDLRIFVQWAVVDAAGSFVNQLSLSPALEIVFGP